MGEIVEWRESVVVTEHKAVSENDKRVENPSGNSEFCRTNW